MMRFDVLCQKRSFCPHFDLPFCFVTGRRSNNPNAQVVEVINLVQETLVRFVSDGRIESVELREEEVR